MRRLLTAALAATLSLCAVNAAAQNNPTPSKTADANSNATKKRGPVFRANKEQVKQAQAVLRQRAFYAGEPTGKLDDSTRAGLRKYQEAEGLKVTGTLNAATLQRMNVALTDKQKTWVAAQGTTGQ